MPRLSMNLTAPIFRHFFPVVPLDLVMHTPIAQTKLPFVYDMSRYLLQGASPLDSKIISKADDNVTPKFQGGYRCYLEIVTPPSQGSMKVSSDGLSFEYVPSLGYTGRDTFCYQITNVMGQYSDYGFISLFVRC